MGMKKRCERATSPLLRKYHDTEWGVPLHRDRKLFEFLMLDGAQAVPHMPVDVQELDCDFYVFSGHKLFGPTGIGILYGKAGYLETMPPFLGGGEMIKSVTFEKTIYADLPYKFEGGTPDIAGAIGLGAAIDYVNNLVCARYVPHLFPQSSS